MKNLAKFLFLLILTALCNKFTSQNITDKNKTDEPLKIETKVPGKMTCQMKVVLLYNLMYFCPKFT